MKVSSIALKQMPKSRLWLNDIARKAGINALKRLSDGGLLIEEEGQQWRFGNSLSPLQAHIVVNTPDAWAGLVFGGGIGAAESYIRQDWETPNLTNVVRVFARNMRVLDSVNNGLAKLKTPLRKAANWWLKNTETQARKNIEAHYDIGNDFYRLFLDQHLMYSSAVFATPQQSLDDAQENKLRTIAEKLDISPRHHVLEIGTGWGGLAIYLAKNYGCRVTTTTISDAQYQVAKQRIADAGLENRIDLLKKDYRQLKGKYDRLVSIEMIEAVGYEYLPTYFKTCANLLKPSGQMLIQAITLQDQRFEATKDDVDFIQKYIFPGGSLPSMAYMLDTTRKHTDLKLIQTQDYAVHYAQTLAHWRERFLKAKQQVASQGFNEQFIRLWHYYLSYCEGGFLEGPIGVHQLVFSKPENRTWDPVLSA